MIKAYSMICDKPVELGIQETVASGGRDCIFKISSLNDENLL